MGIQEGEQKSGRLSEGNRNAADPFWDCSCLRGLGITIMGKAPKSNVSSGALFWNQGA